MTSPIEAPGGLPVRHLLPAGRAAVGEAGEGARARPAGARRAFSEWLALAARSGGLGAATEALARLPGAPLGASAAAGAGPRRTVSALGPAATGAGALGRPLPAPYGQIVMQAARRYNLDPALLAGVIETESGFNPRAVSAAGAKGLMQLMDATARGLGVTDAFDPVQNVDGGARFLRELLDRYQGDVSRALAAYNAGPGAVDRYGGIPPYAETQRYVPKVLAVVARYRRPGEPGVDGPREG